MQFIITPRHHWNDYSIYRITFIGNNVTYGNKLGVHLVNIGTGEKRHWINPLHLKLLFNLNYQND